MKAAITGGSGFIGTRLVDDLLDSGYSPTILDILPSERHKDLHQNVDILDIDALTRALDTDTDVIVHLAAEHRDDVRPAELYDDVNVNGTRNVAAAAEARGITRIVFTSSVAVYGFAPEGTDEAGNINPFNDYGRTKYEAEVVLREWQEKDPTNRSLTIIRPTVVFGEGNRGNVYNLFNQIRRKRFVMIGSGRNKKSMAYVGNLASFLTKSLMTDAGTRVFNYVDKPDYDMNELVSKVRLELHGKRGVGLRLPTMLGLFVGSIADLIARFVQVSLPVSAVRVKKFTESTVFETKLREQMDFESPFTLDDGLQRTLDHDFGE